VVLRKKLRRKEMVVDDPSLDFGFLVAERVEFMPGHLTECRGP
jgi:hypothetical protein